MSLDSYLEIFMTLYGWAFANIIGEVIVGTGLIAVPFVLLVFNAWHDAVDQAGNSLGIVALLDRVGMRLVVALFVMSMAFATTPATSLSHVNLNYTPVADASNPNPQTGGSQTGTNSTFDQAMASAQNGTMSTVNNLSYVPAWWYTVMAISSGFNNAVKSGLKNSGRDLRMIEDTARNATINDPKLLANVQRFYSECFVPARSKYLRESSTTLTASGQALVAESNVPYGPADVDWMGSQLFRTEPGYYADMRSYNPVPDFPIDFNRDVDYYNPAINGDPPYPGAVVNPPWGRPTCKDWWENTSTGVRSKMVNHAGNWQSLLSHLGNAASSLTSDQQTDAVARLAAVKTNPQYVDPSGILGDPKYGFVTNATRGFGNVASSAGLFFMSVFSAISFIPLVNGLLMMQSLVLMALYMFLPIITFLSGFNLRIMFTGAIAIFTVKFWAVMWAVTTWLDARLMDAMYPQLFNWGQLADIFSAGSAGDIIGNGQKRALLNLLLITLLVGLPTIWTGMMAWVGVKLGNQIDGLGGEAHSTANSSAKNTPIVGKRGGK